MQQYIPIDPFIIGTGANFPIVANNIFMTKIQVYYFMIKVRSMGTATYIAHGTTNNLQNRLTTKDSYYEYEAPVGGFLEASDIKILADQADAVVEISGMRM